MNPITEPTLAHNNCTFLACPQRAVRNNICLGYSELLKLDINRNM